MDDWFVSDSGWVQYLGEEGGEFMFEFIVALMNQASLLACDGMLQGEFGVAPFA